MARLKIKEFLKEEIPEADLGSIRQNVLKQANQYEARRSEHGAHVVTGIGMTLMLALLLLNSYSFLQEFLYNLSFLSGISKTRLAFAAVDNILVIGVNLALVFMVNRRFLGIHRLLGRTRRLARNIWGVASRAPSVAWSFLRRP